MTKWATYVLFAMAWGIGILGSLWTAKAEEQISAAVPPTAMPFMLLSTPGGLSNVVPATAAVFGTPTETQATPSPTVMVTCQPPADWRKIIVAPGDTLKDLAEKYHVEMQTLQDANCLPASTLVVGAHLYVPPTVTQQTAQAATPTATQSVVRPLPSPTRFVCKPPQGWVIHVVQPGENLYRLSLAYRVSVFTLQRANCMSSTLIYANQRLWVPNVPTSTPDWTNTPVPTHTPTSTPTFTPTPLPTFTLTPTPTDTPTPTSTSTPTATPTPIPPTSTPTPTPAPTTAVPTQPTQTSTSTP